MEDKKEFNIKNKESYFFKIATIIPVVAILFLTTTWSQDAAISSPSLYFWLYSSIIISFCMSLLFFYVFLIRKKYSNYKFDFNNKKLKIYEIASLLFFVELAIFGGAIIYNFLNSSSVILQNQTKTITWVFFGICAAFQISAFILEFWNTYNINLEIFRTKKGISYYENKQQEKLDSILGEGFVSKWDISSYKKLPKKDLKKLLSDLEYKVTQENFTEPPFDNIYNDFFERGIYIDKVSGEPLFSSQDKFKCGCGWPAFSKAISIDCVVEYDDFTNNMHRIEVRSKLSNSHLGHVFDDGPSPTFKRYCINSASLTFVPYENLEQAGYAEYKEIL